MIATIRELASSLVETGLATQETVVGCTREDVTEFRRVRGIAELPAQYEEFLTVMGRCAGDLLRGTDFFYPDILQAGEWAQELLEENRAEHLFSAGSLALGLHQGYILYWMAPGTPSGPVHRYLEGTDTIEQTWPSLLDFLVYEQARIREVLGR